MRAHARGGRRQKSLTGSVPGERRPCSLQLKRIFPARIDHCQTIRPLAMASLLLDESELLKLSKSSSYDSVEDDDDEVVLLTPLQLLGGGGPRDNTVPESVTTIPQQRENTSQQRNSSTTPPPGHSPTPNLAALDAVRKRHPPNPQKPVLQKQIKHMLANFGRPYGDRPNVLFGWIQDEVLNHHPLYQPLPHVRRVNRTIGSRCLSKIEQHSYHSGELHVGRVTTRYLSAALGMHESGRAAQCMVPQYRSGPKSATKAYNEIKRLRQFVAKKERFDADDSDQSESSKHVLTSARATKDPGYKPNKMLRSNRPNYSYLGSMGNIGQDIFALPLDMKLRSNGSKDGKNVLTKKGKYASLVLWIYHFAQCPYLHSFHFTSVYVYTYMSLFKCIS